MSREGWTLTPKNPKPLDTMLENPKGLGFIGLGVHSLGGGGLMAHGDSGVACVQMIPKAVGPKPESLSPI